MKWIISGIIITVSVAIFTGNMGGAKDAGAKYNKLLRPQNANK